MYFIESNRLEARQVRQLGLVQREGSKSDLKKKFEISTIFFENIFSLLGFWKKIIVFKIFKTKFYFFDFVDFQKKSFFFRKICFLQKKYFWLNKKNEKYLDPSKISPQNDFWWSQDDLSNQFAIFDHLKKMVFFTLFDLRIPSAS